ncbi:MAG: hypothetical protein WEE89_11530, partial [Gemmatimonadota bacterium]
GRCREASCLPRFTSAQPSFLGSNRTALELLHVSPTVPRSRPPRDERQEPLVSCQRLFDDLTQSRRTLRQPRLQELDKLIQRELGFRKVSPCNLTVRIFSAGSDFSDRRRNNGRRNPLEPALSLHGPELDPRHRLLDRLHPSDRLDEIRGIHHLVAEANNFLSLSPKFCDTCNGNEAQVTHTIIVPFTCGRRKLFHIYAKVPQMWASMAGPGGRFLLCQPSLQPPTYKVKRTEGEAGKKSLRQKLQEFENGGQSESGFTKRRVQVGVVAKISGRCVRYIFPI